MYMLSLHLQHGIWLLECSFYAPVTGAARLLLLLLLPLPLLPFPLLLLLLLALVLASWSLSYAVLATAAILARLQGLLGFLLFLQLVTCLFICQESTCWAAMMQQCHRLFKSASIQ